MTPQEELDVLRININALNDKKGAIIRAWEGEKIRQKDPFLEKPEELKALNQQLGAHYGRRDAILEQHPEFAAEYGGKKKSVSGMRQSPLGSSPRAAANKAAKKAKYLANREARRIENQQRASQRVKGSK